MRCSFAASNHQKILFMAITFRRYSPFAFILLFNLNSLFVMAQEQNAVKAENDPHILSDIRSFLKALNTGGGKPIEQLSPADARQALVGAQKSAAVDYSGIDETEKVITQDGITVTIHIVKPKDVKTNGPVFLFFHGGGWVLGDYPTHRRLVRDLVVESGVTAVFPDYTPSPEAKYPVAINQAYAATKWVAENGHAIGVNGKNLAVVGNSVGGNMAAVVALMAKDKKGPEIKLQVLFWPVTNANFETASYYDFANDRFLTRNMMIWFWDNYTTNPHDRSQIYASPLLATTEQLRHLPPTLVQTAENDVLRDEGEAYARKLDEAGVPVTLTRYEGLIHDYGLLNPLTHVPAVKTAILQAAVIIRDALK
jgi:acetyl esterase/lipase